MKVFIWTFIAATVGTPLVADTIPLRAKSESVTLTVPGPEWARTAETSVQSGVSGMGKPISITEFIPGGESFDLWTELFAVMIEEKIDLTLEQYK